MSFQKGSVFWLQGLCHDYIRSIYTIFEITPASTDDWEDLRDIVEGQSGLIILDDKGHVGESLTREMEIRGSALWYSNGS